MYCFNLQHLKEIKQLKDALYPNMMCAAAKNGDINSLERLRDTVSVGWICENIHFVMFMSATQVTFMDSISDYVHEFF